jgi:hypothetical protein
LTQNLQFCLKTCKSYLNSHITTWASQDWTRTQEFALSRKPLIKRFTWCLSRFGFFILSFFTAMKVHCTVPYTNEKPLVILFSVKSECENVQNFPPFPSHSTIQHLLNISSWNILEFHPILSPLASETYPRRYLSSSDTTVSPSFFFF